MTNGYLDPNGYKRGKGQGTSQIKFSCQYEQTGNKSWTNSTLALRNGEAVIISAMIERLGGDGVCK